MKAHSFLALGLVVVAGFVGAAEVVVDVVELFGELVELAGEPLNFRLGAAVDVEVEFAADAVFTVLAVLAHHDDRRLDGGEHREEEVEQDVGIGGPMRFCRERYSCPCR